MNSNNSLSSNFDKALDMQIHNNINFSENLGGIAHTYKNKSCDIMAENPDFLRMLGYNTDNIKAKDQEINPLQRVTRENIFASNANKNSLNFIKENMVNLENNKNTDNNIELIKSHLETDDITNFDNKELEDTNS